MTSKQLFLHFLNASRICFVLKDNDAPVFREFMQVFIAEFAGEMAFLTLPVPSLLSSGKVNENDLILIWEPTHEELEKIAFKCGSVVYSCASNKVFHEIKRDNLLDAELILTETSDFEQIIDEIHEHRDDANEALEQKKDKDISMPCLFLDRDGVVNIDVPYNNDPKKVVLCIGIEGLIREAHQRNFWVAVVSNQSGLAVGKISKHEHFLVNEKVNSLLAERGVFIDFSEFGFFHDEAIHDEASVGANFRKPRSGMFKKLTRERSLNVKTSIMVGDSARDLIAAFAAGVADLILVKREKKEDELIKLMEFQKSCPKFKYRVVNEYSEIWLKHSSN